MNREELELDIVQALKDLGQDGDLALCAHRILDLCKTEEQVLQYLNQYHPVRGVL